MFEEAIKVILQHEGGYVNDPDDRGGETNYGITKKVAISFGYEGNMKGIPMKIVKEIYKKNYWDACKCSKFKDNNLKLLIFDTAVNMGNRTSIRLLQRAYNVLNREEIVEDGIVGNQTITHCNSYSHKKDLNFWFNILRAERYKSIVDNNESQKRFIRGWGRRLQDMLKRSL